MAESTIANENLKQFPSSYDSSKDVGDVLIGEDTARSLIEASSSGDHTTLQSLLSQPQCIKTMLESPHTIYSERQGPDGTRKVMATPTLNLERALTAAAENGHAAVVSTLLAFAKDHNINTPDEATARTMINKIISGGHADVFKALALADPKLINFRLPHGTLPLYEAVRLRKTDVVAVLLELGADPLHPVQPAKKLATHHSSLLSHASFSEGPRMTEMLLERGAPIANTGALHTAAYRGELDTMRLLMQHGPDVNEILPNWSDRTPMHFAASKGRIDAMKLLEEHGAHSNVKDKDGKTPANLLEEHQTS